MHILLRLIRFSAVASRIGATYLERKCKISLHEHKKCFNRRTMQKNLAIPVADINISLGVAIKALTAAGVYK
jgi:hypothetical protein